MKKLSFLLLIFSFFTTANAQIVTIPVANFKAKLLAANTTNGIAQNLSGVNFKIDANNDGEIQESEALNLSYLDVSFYGVSKISDLTGIEYFTNLTTLNCANNNISDVNINVLTNLKNLNCVGNRLINLNLLSLNNLQNLYCQGNLLTNLDLTGLKNIQNVICWQNQITNLNLTGLDNLQYLDCQINQLTNLNLTGLTKLKTLSCSSNQLSTLDITSLPNLSIINAGFNKLISLFLKNGTDEVQEGTDFSNNPNLSYVCEDEQDINKLTDYLTSTGIINVIVNSYCSFIPGGTFYTVDGNAKLDNNNNGCDFLDTNLPNLKFNITNGSVSGSKFDNATGNYSIPVSAGTHTITPVLENPTYFTVFPSTVNVTFPTQTSPFTQNFCITPNGVRPDLEVILLPLVPARPGFDAKYKLVYKNKGNIAQSGSVNLTFNDAVMDLVVANPVVSTKITNKLTWNFTTLQPLETREITFTVNVNSPMETPAVNNGDILAYSATISSVAIDETPTDNTFAFNQTVVGSYDPNDKTCLEGSVITPNLIGQYVHYTIRFENTGTFAAENVVVKDMIDLTKFDISTLVPTSASHSYTTRISDGNKVEFIFENINLPFDDANNDGYIAFKIKTKSTLVVNDSFSNEASIFFDYNFPIVTNKATSTFKTLGTQDFDFDSYFTIYPNPAINVLNITTKEFINIGTVNVYNTLGQLVIAIPNAEKLSSVDVSNLKSGNYFIQIKTDKGSSSSQFVKE